MAMPEAKPMCCGCTPVTAAMFIGMKVSARPGLTISDGRMTSRNRPPPGVAEANTTRPAVAMTEPRR